MPVAVQEYELEHLIKFLKEEFERIIVQWPWLGGLSIE